MGMFFWRPLLLSNTLHINYLILLLCYWMRLLRLIIIQSDHLKGDLIDILFNSGISIWNPNGVILFLELSSLQHRAHQKGLLSIWNAEHKSAGNPSQNNNQANILSNTFLYFL